MLLRCCCLDVIRGISIVFPTFSAILTLCAYICAKLESIFFPLKLVHPGHFYDYLMCLHNVKCCFLEFDSDTSKVRQVLVDGEKNNKLKRSDAGQNLLCISAACRIPVSISITILS